MLATIRHTTNKNQISIVVLLLLAIGVGLAGCAGLVSQSSTSTGGGSTPFAITNAAATAATLTGFQVDWTTSAPGNSQVVYGKTASYGSTTALDATMVSTHQVNIASLTPGTTYHFQIHSTDASGNNATSADMTFATLGDTTAPTVSITSPAAGATLSGSAVIVSANASDNVGVAGVQFKVDSVSTGPVVVAAPYTYSLNTTTLSNGNHTLSAVATDAAGNSATSASVVVSVNNTTKDTTPPTVSMTAPASGATVSGTTTVSATASDNVAVASVQFQLDNVNVGSADLTSPYTYSWDTTKSTNGSHTLRAIATDTSSNATTSTAITVTVSNNSTDTTAPSVPTGLGASAVSSSQINLTWTASTDNVGVTGYNILRGGTKVATSTATNYLDSGLTASTSYTYTVSAFDAAGNTSGQSASASATTQASSGGGSIPNTLGWYQIPNTTMQPVCSTDSSIQGTSGCGAVISAWGSGVADTKRNRLVFWGGGHFDYAGNEIYALDLNANPPAMLRLNNPSNPTSMNCVETESDGNPSSRHTYGGLSYIAAEDILFMHGGAPYACSSPESVATWTFSESTMKWTHMDPMNGTPVTQDCCNYINFSAYDPASDKVYFFDDSNFWKYDYPTNTLTNVGNQQGVDYHSSAVIDEGRHLFFMFGEGLVWKADISTGGTTTINDITSQTTGCSALAASEYAGLAYDSVQKLIVGWTGGDSVYLFNPANNTCTTQTYPNGPGAAQGNGTNGRFRYFSALGVFALVNGYQENAYTLRLTAATGGTGSTGPNISAVTATSITTTGATITWTTDVTATSQVDYGTTTSYGTSTTLDSTLVTAHSVALTGLTAGTVYHYRVHSRNSAGTETLSGDSVFSTTSTGDTMPPTISITAPASGATVSGTVTVTATASDNVGVASVQFQLDGANLGAVDTATPYSVSWDTTTATNATHTLTAQAKDAAGNVGNATAVTVTVANTGDAALADFQSRCATSGVLVCEGFDNASEFAPATWPNSGVYPAGDNTIRIVQDTSIKASGNGSAKFPIPANDTVTGANLSGSWLQAMGRSFGPGDTFYVQFRFRMDTAMQSTNWEDNAMGGSSPKIAIFHHVGNTCASEELTTNNRNGTSMPMMYSQCGSNILGVIPGTTDWTNATPPYQYQNGYYNCQYDTISLPPGGCYTMPANTWLTFYYKVTLGAWGTASSQITAWIAPQGQQLQKFIDISNMTINQDGTNLFDSVTLLNYMTAFGQLQPPTNPAANSWYDELIVATAPIPAPAGQGPVPQ